MKTKKKVSKKKTKKKNISKKSPAKKVLREVSSNLGGVRPGAGRPKTLSKDICKTLFVKVTARQLKAIDACAAKKGKSRSQMVRLILDTLAKSHL